MSRLFINELEKTIVVLSYAGGTKYFRHLTETVLKKYKQFNATSLTDYYKDFRYIQIVRYPVERYMSWFDKQYIKPLFKESKTELTFAVWINQLITKEWIDQFIIEQQHFIHYDGHINFQSLWPKQSLKSVYNDSWEFLRMEDIDAHFLKGTPYISTRNSKEYAGVWELLDQTTKEYFLKNITEIYNYDIKWYNSRKLINP